MSLLQHHLTLGPLVSTDMNPYTYSPLNTERHEIRLLEILQDDWTEPLRCRLRIASLDDQLPYKTLSYVWGQSDPKCDIRVDDCVVSVNPNLFDAIRRLRAHISKDTLVIWVDALCVNQSNVPERDYSVGLMRRIYTQCTEVLVWLGEIAPAAYRLDGTPDQELRDTHRVGCDCLQSVWAEVSDRATDPLKPEHVKATMRVLHRFGTARDCGDIQLCRVFQDMDEMVAYRSTMRFLDDNAWFSRVWTLQEIVLAPSAYGLIGDCGFSFEIFFDAINLIGTHQRNGCCILLSDTRLMGWTSLGRIGEIRTLRQFNRLEVPLADPYSLRMSIAGRQASLDVDLVYGVLGICQSQIVPQ